MKSQPKKLNKIFANHIFAKYLRNYYSPIAKEKKRIGKNGQRT